MRSAHAVAVVREAEQSLRAKVPDGALMQRAAAGLAATCASLLDGVYGARVVVLAGSGDNGGDALYAGARLAGRGASVVAVAAGARLHQAAAAELLAQGGRIVAATELAVRPARQGRGAGAEHGSGQDDGIAAAARGPDRRGRSDHRRADRNRRARRPA